MIAKYLKTGLIRMCVLGVSNKSVAQTSAKPVKKRPEPVAALIEDAAQLTRVAGSQ